ncbi:MAG: aliphatic sulfonates ABC transporter substrate-binding protein, partial [Cyanobacteria bacterium J06554_3]
MKRRRLLSLCLAFFCTMVVTVSCGTASDSGSVDEAVSDGASEGAPIVIGYSNWAGWWPWAIA